MHEAFLVALVGVVVAGEEVAVFVEEERLRVAQAGGEELEARAVGPAAEDGAHVGRVDRAAFLGFHVGAAVADRHVDAAVGPEDQAVEIMAGEIEAQAETAEQLGAGFRLVVAGEFPERRDVGEPDIIVADQDAGRDAVDGRAKVVGIDGGLVGHAVAVGVLEQRQALGLLRQFLDVVLAEQAVDHGEEVVLIAVGKVVLEDPHIVADIEHAAAVAVGLGHEHAALLVEIERDRVGEHRFGGPELGLEAGRDLHAGERLGGLVGRRVDDRRGQALERLEVAALALVGIGDFDDFIGGEPERGIEKDQDRSGEGRQDPDD
ncbi:MAG: hypothetical protein WDM96_10200 [Lacunisphaera sp.]